MPLFQPHVLIITLVLQFWISGLFVLSVIFTQNQQLDDLTLFTFIAYAIGSFLAGVLSDILGRRPIFLFSSILLTLSAALLWVYPFYGYILANLAIGPLNNLTFVYINEVHPDKAEKYTILVLIGWAFSEITLGTFFYFSNTQLFAYFLFTVTVVFMILSLLYVKQTSEFLKDKTEQNQINALNVPIKQTLNNQSCQQDSRLNGFHKAGLFMKQRILPLTLKPLIGGSILMFTMQMFYYRTQFTLDTFGVSLEINTVVVGCTEVFANVLFTKILQSTKRLLALRLLVASLMILLVFLIFSSQRWVQTVVEGFMRLVDTAIMIVLGVYIPQLFPSKQRGRGTNFIMSFGVIGSALNGKVFNHLPFWSLQLFLLCALATTLLLKQTNTNSQKRNDCSQQTKGQFFQDSLIKSELE